MKKIPTLLLLLLSHFSYSQNLVPNPSFEQYDTCPNFISQIDYAIGWSSYRNTPDYYNSCAPNEPSGVSVPSNVAGYRFARTGNAYAGLFTKSGSEYREWIGSQLIQSLIIGKEYFVSFFVSMGFKGQIGIATNKIGARFSTVPYSSINQLPLNGYAQVYTDSIISDTLNWVKVSGSFIADSAYNYIVIGNFFNDSLTSTILLNQNAIEAYYYIDDATVSDSLTDGIDNNYSFSLIKVFPNPARDWIVIRGNDIQSLVLFDVLGRTVYVSDSEFISPITINTSSFQRGTYFLTTKTKSTIVTQKINLQ